MEPTEFHYLMSRNGLDRIRHEAAAESACRHAKPPPVSKGTHSCCDEQWRTLPASLTIWGMKCLPGSQAKLLHAADVIFQAASILLRKVAEQSELSSELEVH